jgi:ATP-dependent RNA helicase RhlE
VIREEIPLTDFATLGLSPALLEVLAAEGYTQPTPIQAQAIPHLLAGRDLLGIAQTGTGKTAAFALPILQRLAANPRKPSRGTCRVLVLSPTRELASQIGESFRTYAGSMPLGVAVIFGGVGYKPQTDRLARGVDVLVATPGRLIDHLDQRTLDLSKTEVFVLDEADRMLDMGFIRDIRKITPKLPKERHSLFFSATMPGEVSGLVADLLRDPVRVEVTPVATTAERISQRVLFVETGRKRALLGDVIREEKPARAIVFTRTKHGADKVVKSLEQEGIASAAIHGNKSQNQREKALEGFRTGATPILIATDIAARGIDVDGITHVINFDLPNIPESYVHRIGRTARAGAEGVAISFCDQEERAFLRDIEKLTRQQIPATDRRIAGGEALETREATETNGRRGGQRGRPGQGRNGAPQGRNGASQGRGGQRSDGQRSDAPRGDRPAQPARGGQQQPARAAQAPRGAAQPARGDGGRRDERRADDRRPAKGKPAAHAASGDRRGRGDDRRGGRDAAPASAEIGGMAFLQAPRRGR